MPYRNERTVVSSVANFPDTSSRDELATVFYNELSEYDDIEAIQLLPHSVCKVTFSDPETKRDFCKETSFFVGDVECYILNHVTPSTLVIIHHYPVEAPEEPLSFELKKYGDIESSRFQICTHMERVSTGSRLFCMKLKQDIPRNFRFSGYRVQVLYKEQPLECDICQGHQ